jgi:hypothetical protein
VSYETRARVPLCILAVAAILAVPAAAAADADSAGPLCVGLDCGSPVSRDYVPEAHGAAPAVAGLDELKAQRESGFYEIPALVWQGDVQPQAVVYLSKPGQFARMPASVRNLRVVRDFELTLGSGLNAATLVVIDHGIMRVIPGDLAAARRRPKAQAAHTEPWRGCSDRYFCLYGTPDWGGGIDPWCGPCYYGAGWINFSPDFGSSMVNHRDGDSLIADGYDGNGARYCARQQSEDSTFSGNPIGNDRANSVALLGSSPDRC